MKTSRKTGLLIRLVIATFAVVVFVSNAAAANYDENYYQTNLVSGVPFAEFNKWLDSESRFNDFETEQWADAAMWCIRHLRHNVSKGDLYGYDGVSGEGGNYHFFGLGNLLERAQRLIGYTIPTHYTFPAINEFQGTLPPKGVPLTLDDILPRWVKSNQFVQNAMFLTYPDGRDCGVHDSGYGAATDPTDPWEWENDGWSGAGLDPKPWENDRLAHNYLLGSFGQIGLGGGPLSGGTNQTQAMLHFSTRNGHAAADTLAIALFGRGRTLFGYTSYYGGSALSFGSWHGPHNKNMPIINNGWQNKYLKDDGWHDCHGHVEICAFMPGVQVSRVDGSHIYHGGSYSKNHGELLADRYRRTLMLNTVDADRAYLVDICELDGGSTHDYVLGGFIKRENSVPYSDLNLTQSTAFPYVIENTWTGYDLNKLSSGTYADTSSFYIDTGFADNANLGARIHIPPQGEAGTLYLGWINDPFYYSTETPKWGPNDDKGRWHMMLHREGTDIKSTFVAVHEVKDGSGTSFIQSIDRTSVGTDAIAITVTLTDGRQDTYLVSFDGQKTMTHNGVSANATIAVSSRSGAVSDLWMVNGSSVTDANKTLSDTTGEITGEITQVNRTLFRTGTSDSFETDAIFPVGEELRGQTLIVELVENNLVKVVNSYTIETVEALASGSRVHLRTDPGLVITGASVKEDHYPHRTATSARLRFIPQATTVPQLVAIGPDPEDWKRLKVRKSMSAGANGEITLTTLPDHADVRCHIGSRSLVVNDTISVDGISTVEFEVPNPDGLTTPRNIKQRYHTRFPALPGTVDASKPGLVARMYTGNWNKSFDPTASFNTYTFGASQVIDGFTDGEVTFNADDAGVIIKGYIDVPATGLYTFYTRFDSGAKLEIDGEILTSQLGMRSWASWKSTIYLEQGPHAIEVDTMCRNRSYGGHMQLYWEGPGVAYQAVPDAYLYRELVQTNPAYELSYSAGSGGSLQGVTNQVVSSGGDGTTVTAVASNGYGFVCWSDGELSASRTDQSITQHLLVKALFEAERLTLVAATVPLSADEANSSPSGWGGSILNTVNDPFLFEPANPTAVLPVQVWSGSDGYHGQLDEGTNVVLVYSLTSGALSLSAGDTFAVDLYGRDDLNDRCQDIDIELYSGGFGGTLVTSISGQKISLASPYYVRAELAPTSAFDTVVVIGHDTTAASGNAFTLMEIRTATLIPANSIPVADAGNASVDEGNSVVVTLTGSDADRNPLTYTVETQPANGVLSGTAPNLTYTPNTNFNGADSFTFTVNDGTTNSAAATVSITVNAVTTYTLTYTAGANGSITGTNPQTVADGADGSAITAVADSGYLFLNWSDASTANPRTDAAVTGDINITANFGADITSASFVGINFGSDRKAMSASDTAGVISAANWNNVPGGSGTVANILDRDGLATTMDVTYSAHTSWYAGGTSTSDENMMRGYLDGGRSGALPTVTISQIPYALYDVYVYHQVDTDGNGGSVILNGTESKYIKDAAGTFFGSTGDYVEDVQGADFNSTTAGHYVKFTGVTGTTFSITSSRDLLRVGFTGIQIVNIPTDSDGDGWTDAQELALGTDPNDPDSGFGIEGFPLPATGKVQITWPSATGVLYKVWKSPDLTNWSSARDWTTALTPPEDTFEFDLSPTNGFFKVEAEIQ